MADRTPSDHEALAALATLRAWLGVGAASSAEVHDQDHLPPGEEGKRDHFLRLHAQRVRDGVRGWSRLGKRRIVTAQAWEAELERETSRARARAPKLALVPTARNVSAELDRALGIRTRGTR